MQVVKSLFRRAQAHASQVTAQDRTVSAPVLLSQQDLKHVSGGLPHVPVTGSVVTEPGSSLPSFG
jgi:hypothetical protein